MYSIACSCIIEQVLSWLPWQIYAPPSACYVFLANFELVQIFSTQENFPQKENFVKGDWPTQIFCLKKF
jgi:hypothetical protein